MGTIFHCTHPQRQRITQAGSPLPFLSFQQRRAASPCLLLSLWVHKQTRNLTIPPCRFWICGDFRLEPFVFVGYYLTFKLVSTHTLKSSTESVLSCCVRSWVSWICGWHAERAAGWLIHCAARYELCQCVGCLHDVQWISPTWVHERPRSMMFVLNYSYQYL